MAPPLAFQPAGVVTLLTDFGLSDPYVGVLKGVILAEDPSLRVVDLTHGIRPQAVVEGCFWVERSFGWFPAGTVHLCVVDPGVGTARPALLVECDGHLLLGPDNGLLGGVAARAQAVRRLDAPALGLGEPSRTFHGRDVFAPVAARLAAGRLAPADAGPLAGAFAPGALPEPEWTREGVVGTVVTVDRFGNLITNLTPAHLEELERPELVFDGVARPLVGTYAEVRPGAPLGLVGSFGAIEIAVRDGDASRTLGLGPGARVLLREAE